MGQILEKNPEPRVPYEEDGDNGLVFGDKYLPEELIAEILCYVDCNSLLSGQLVCKRWKTLIRSYVWRKKAEMTIGHSLQSLQTIPSERRTQVYYTICRKEPFNKNLLKNHSGEMGVEEHWEVLRQGGDHWKVENPPEGVSPLPRDEPLFRDKQCCFVTSYYTCSKQQTIKLASEGLIPQLLDAFQPPIVISEWYSCRWDCPAIYECSVKLIGKNKEIMDEFQLQTLIENDEQNQWHRISHTFTNYGRGLEEVTFYHGGRDNLFWAGHYGSKMAGASVIVKLPECYNTTDDMTRNTNNSETKINEVESNEPQRMFPLNWSSRMSLELD